MDKAILNLLVWIFLLGGLFGMVMGFMKVFDGSGPAEYGVMGTTGGLWLLSCAITMYIRKKIDS